MKLNRYQLRELILSLDPEAVNCAERLGQITPKQARWARTDMARYIGSIRRPEVRVSVRRSDGRFVGEVIQSHDETAWSAQLYGEPVSAGVFPDVVQAMQFLCALSTRGDRRRGE